MGAPPAVAPADALPYSAGSLSLIGKPAKPSPLGLDTSASTTSAPVVALAPSMLRGKTLDEIVNNWSRELGGRTRDFVDIAGEVRDREWDKVLRENGEKVRELHPRLLAFS